MNTERIHHILENQGVVSADLFCTVHRVEGDKIVTIYSSHPQPEHLGDWQSISKGVVGDSAKKSSTNLVPDVDSYADYVGMYPSVRLEFALPGILKGKTVGVINFESTQVGYFNQSQKEFADLADEIDKILLFYKDGKECRYSNLTIISCNSRIFWTSANYPQ